MQPLLSTVRVKVYGPQLLPAITETDWLLVDPDIVALPDIDHAYVAIPGGPLYEFVDPGQTLLLPVMLHVGLESTVSCAVSRLDRQPLNPVAVT